MDILYEYMLDWSKGSKRRHVDGERNFIERYIPRDEFKELFEGEMLLTDTSGQLEFIGVWGRQAISKFKGILRERGADFEVLHVEAQDRVVKIHSQYYGKEHSASRAGVHLRDGS